MICPGCEEETNEKEMTEHEDGTKLCGECTEVAETLKGEE